MVGRNQLSQFYGKPGAAVILFSLIVSATAGGFANDQHRGGNYRERIEQGFSDLQDRPSAAIGVAAYHRAKGPRFAAATCLLEPIPRLACEGVWSMEPLRVTTIGIIPWIGDSTTAPTTAASVSGRWEGDGYVLKIDVERAQANTASDLPFEWKRLILSGVMSGELVFTIGAELFSAQVEPDEMAVTSTSFRGQMLLRRVKM